MTKVGPGSIEQRLKAAGVDTNLSKRLASKEQHRARAAMLTRDLLEVNEVIYKEQGNYVVESFPGFPYLLDMLFELYDKESVMKANGIPAGFSIPSPKSP